MAPIPARQVADEPRVPHQPEQHAEQRGNGEPVGKRVAQRRRFQVAAQHARRRYALQLQHRRQRKAHEDRERRRQAQDRGRERRWRQVGPHEVAQKSRQQFLRKVTERAADNGRDQGDQRKLDDGDPQDEGLRSAHAFHECDVVEVPLRVASRRHRDGNRREQDRDHRGEIQETPRALRRGLDLRALLGNPDQALALRLSFLQLHPERADPGRLPGEQQRIRRAASGTQKPGGIEVRERNQERRREIDEGRALVRAVIQDLGHLECRGADAHAIADAGADPRKQARIEPGLAAARQPAGLARRLERRVRDLDAPAQRIAGADGPDCRERRFRAEVDDARK